MYRGKWWLQEYWITSIMKNMKYLLLLPILVFFFESVKFYEISDKERYNQNYRILVKAESDSVDISSGCTPSNGLPTTVETIVLVKKGVYSSVSLQIAWLTCQAKHWYMVKTKSHNENIKSFQGTTCSSFRMMVNNNYNSTEPSDCIRNDQENEHFITKT